MTVVRLLVGSELRRRRLALLGLALIVGLVGGVVLTAAAGARRTSTALDRLLEKTDARDATVQIDESGHRLDDALTAVESLPEIEASGRYSIYPVYSSSVRPLVEKPHDPVLMASPDGRYFTEVDRPIIEAGRMPHPGAVGEVVVNTFATREYGIEVGDRVELQTFRPADLDKVLSGGKFPGFNGPAFGVVVVGIVSQPEQLQGSQTTVNPAVIGTPALLDRYGARMGGFESQLAVQLRDPEADLSAVDAAVTRSLGPDGEWEVRSIGQEFAESAQRAIDVLATALSVFALVATAAALLALGGAVSRQVEAAYDAGAVLRALGVPRGPRVIARMAPSAFAIVVGGALAGAFAVAASPVLPIGIARRAEPDTGMAIDASVLGLGVIALCVLGIAWAYAVAWRSERAAARSERARPSTVAGFVSRSGLSPSMSTGIRYAFERGASRVPVRSALVGSVIGIAGIVGIAVVVASLDGLVASPSRYGWAWSASPDAEGIDTQTLQALVADRDLAAVGFIHSARVDFGEVTVQGIAVAPERGAMTPTIRDGRAPASASEVALGARTASRLGVEVGDQVSARKGGGALPLTVVGTAVLPPVDNPNSGDGAVLTPDGFESVRSSDGFSNLAVSYRDGADADALEARLAKRYGIGFSAYSAQRVPGDVSNLDAARGVIVGLGVFFGALGCLGLAHALVVSTRRRRHDLATMRALGIARRGTGAIVRVQACAIAVTGVLVGVPVGLAAGRAVWNAMVGDLGLIDFPTNPWGALLLVGPLAVAAALVISLFPARAAVRTAPSAALRSE